MRCHTSAVHESFIGSSNTSGMFPSTLPHTLLIFKDFIALKKTLGICFRFDMHTIPEELQVMWGRLLFTVCSSHGINSLINGVFNGTVKENEKTEMIELHFLLWLFSHTFRD